MEKVSKSGKNPMNEKSSLVKLYYSDIGLLTYACGDALRQDILFDRGNMPLIEF